MNGRRGNSGSVRLYFETDGLVINHSREEKKRTGYITIIMITTHTMIILEEITM